MYTLLVYEKDVLALSVIAAQYLNVVFLNEARLFYYAVLGVCENLGEEPLPFSVCEAVIVELFELKTQVVYQVLFFVYGKAFVAELDEQAYKLCLELCFALVSIRTLILWFVFGYNGAFVTLRNDVKVAHSHLRL